MNDQLSDDLASLRIARDDPRPPFRWGRLVVVLLVLGGAAAGVYFALPLVQSKLFKTEVDVTEVSLVSPSQGAVDLTSTGYVVPQTVAKVGAKVAGRVAKAFVREGDKVKAGQILFELDATDQKSAVASAQARVYTARARAQAARARAQAARANVAEIQTQWDRQKKLVASGAMAPATAEDLEMRVRALQAQVGAADSEATAGDAEATAAQAEVTMLATNVGNMTIVSPIDGTALSKAAEVGEVVTPASTLVELADFRTLMVETDVPEGRLHLAKVAGPCEIILDAFPDKRFGGTVAEVSPRLNRAKATGTIKVKFDDPSSSGALPEMAARVSFHKEKQTAEQLSEKPKKIVPAVAIVERGGVQHVFVLDGDKVRMVQVELGPAFGGGFELREGPPPGTKLIKSPPATMTDGQPVKERSSQ